MLHPYLVSAIGGLLIGAAIWLLLIGIGRIAGVSGITASAITGAENSAWRWAFLLGLIVGGAVFSYALHLSVASVAPRPWLVGAGLLVGVGTVLANGCTSGHGVCGLGRGSLRSLVATLTFMVTGALTVAAVHALRGISQ